MHDSEPRPSATRDKRTLDGLIRGFPGRRACPRVLPCGDRASLNLVKPPARMSVSASRAPVSSSRLGPRAAGGIPALRALGTPRPRPGTTRGIGCDRLSAGSGQKTRNARYAGYPEAESGQRRRPPPLAMPRMLTARLRPSARPCIPVGRLGRRRRGKPPKRESRKRTAPAGTVVLRRVRRGGPESFFRVRRGLDPATHSGPTQLLGSRAGRARPSGISAP